MKRRIFIKNSAAGTLLCVMPMSLLFDSCTGKSRQTTLEDAFFNPPASAKAKTWWHWMNGNVTKQGITLDLEAMKKVGIGGFQIFDVGSGIVEGPVVYHSKEWFELKEHAAKEAERLGLAYEMHNCPGWSSSGGPWMTPEHAMKYLVWSETYISGGKPVQTKLQQPTTNLDYYRDSMVLAFPSIKGEELSMCDRIENVVSNNGEIDKKIITNGDVNSWVDIKPNKGDLAFFQVKLKEPQSIRAFILGCTILGVKSYSVIRSPRTLITLEASDDGQEYRKVCKLKIGGKGVRTGVEPLKTADFPSVRAKYFRITASRGTLRVKDFQLTSGRIEYWDRKSMLNGFSRTWPEGPEKLPADIIIDPAKVLDISKYMDGQGQLSWDAPVGNWTILRFGYTLTSIDNNASPSTGNGLECDKFSKEAYEFHFRNMFDKLLPVLKNLSEKGMAGALVDSYEVGVQNWTNDFPQQFKNYRGYHLKSFLPAMTGRFVGSKELSDRFLYDIRKTGADLIADNYFGTFSKLCKEHGLISYTEPYGGPNDEIQAGCRVDVPMGEFWIRSTWANEDARRIKMASSVAHVSSNLNQIVGAEAFSGKQKYSRWMECPYMMKSMGDWMYTLGLNQFIFHRFALQPHPTAVPGMTMGPWGFHFDRTNTWFPKANGWLKYVARCQNMLRQGKFVADIACFTGEQKRNRAPGKANLLLPVPLGYDYDLVNAETILKEMQFENGHFVLGNGMCYKVLVLSKQTEMSMEVLLKLQELVKKGGVVVGPKPLSSPSLADHFNNGDEQFRKITDEIWGDVDGVNVVAVSYGKGKIFWEKNLQDILDKQNITPDFEYSAKNPGAVINYIHRNVDGDDVYFVSNYKRNAEDLLCSFRIDGKLPEIWNPETGKIMEAGVYEISEGKVLMPLRLENTESVFVVFRSAAPSSRILSIKKDNQSIAGIQPFSHSEEVNYSSVTNNFTVNLWVKPETDLDIPLTGDVVASYNYVVFPPKGEMQYGEVHATCGLLAGRNGFVVCENQNTIPKAVLVAEMPVSGWTHVALVYKEGTPSLFVNGEYIKEGQKSDAVVHPVENKTCKIEEGINFEGNSTTPEIKAEVLSKGEIMQMAEAGLPEPEGLPVLSFCTDKSGKTGIVLREEGSYILKMNDGKELVTKVAGLEKPKEITSPWKVRFPDGLGAPSEIQMDKLIALNRHSDDGVKYFSGTASYHNTFDVKAGLFETGKKIYLDLGRVEVLAELIVNGKNLGVLWKLPYRIDITEAVVPGKNELEVQITNLWPNRLIGDEQLPEEYDYSGSFEDYPGGIKKIPEWFLKGEPQPGERITFSTWKHFEKDDPLLESGLLGPVRLVHVQYVVPES